MQSLLRVSKAPGAAVDACARDLLDSVPLVMRVIRHHMRRHRSGLTVPQFRTLCYLSTTEGSSLSAVADFIGLSLPAMSRMIDGLVEQKLVARKSCEDDRRHIRLSVTDKGEASLGGARELAQDELAKSLSALSREQLKVVNEAMKTLRDVFTPELPADDSLDVEGGN